VVLGSHLKNGFLDVSPVGASLMALCLGLTFCFFHCLDFVQTLPRGLSRMLRLSRNGGCSKIASVGRFSRTAPFFLLFPLLVSGRAQLFFLEDPPPDRLFFVDRRLEVPAPCVTDWFLPAFKLGSLTFVFLHPSPWLHVRRKRWDSSGGPLDYGCCGPARRLLTGLYNLRRAFFSTGR